MLKRTVMMSGFALVLASPALADCMQELTALEPNVVSAETGAAPDPSGMPVTKHQEETMAGKQVDKETTGSTGQVEATSPHQEQVTGKRSSQSAEHPSQVMAEAKKMAESGDEQGCMNKVTELKEMLGAN
ncbi:hypothetical protein [Mesorhizobium sp. 1B3]|uniref:hypothetical protein n=1 Tax=Mesorhizobium sp. 1B3 TaxID=3243599 RepID=UPI003D97CFF7